MMVNGHKSLYNHLEQVIIQLEESNKIIKEQSKNIKELTKTIKAKDEVNAKLLLEIERLRNQINKDSNNSSKPPSTDQPKRSGANLYNNRIKTGKKVGGQVGHKGHNLSKAKVEKMIADNNLIVKTINHNIHGTLKKEIVKYRLGIEVIPYVEKHVFKCDPKYSSKLPKEFYTDVTYHESIKCLCIHLGIYNLIAYERMSDFLNVVTKGIVNVSNGTLVNFLKEFSIKSETVIETLETKLLNGKVLYTDETGTKHNKKNIYFRNYSNLDISLYKVNKRKGHKAIKDGAILTNYQGGIMGDHDTALYSYGTKNYECNVHLERYLKELIQNIEDISWAKEMSDLFKDMNKQRKITKEGFTKDKLITYNHSFDELIKKAKAENKTIKSKFYKEKAEKLYRRLIKYKENHLAFIYDFDVPYSNNLSERDLRMLKTKTKVSGGFRSFEVAKHYANALSIIKTAKKQDINPYDAISKVYTKQKLFA